MADNDKLTLPADKESPKGEGESLASEKTRRARGRRALEEQRERRKRDGTRTSGQYDILYVPADIRDDAERRGVSLRWARATSTRSEQLRGTEWVPSKHNGQNVFKPAGGNDADKLVLMEKDKDWLREDLAEQQRRIDVSLEVDRNKALAQAKAKEGEALVGYQVGDRVIDDRASKG